MVNQAAGGKEALASLAQVPVDVVLLDVRMPGMDGIETLKPIKARSPVVEVILLTGHGAVDTAVKGLKSYQGIDMLSPSERESV